MCTNAMKYNHAETVYYKASKKLLQAGLKIIAPDKLGWMINLVPEITSEEIGFEITPEMRAIKHNEDHEDGDIINENKRKMPSTKFEAIPDDLTPEEILAKSQIAARHAKAKLSRLCMGQIMSNISVLSFRESGVFENFEMTTFNMA